MRLGIDFGTTRVVVAAADRGNYPVVTFEDDGGAYDQRDAKGFIRLNALRMRIAANAKAKRD